VAFGKEYIMRCASAEWIARSGYYVECLEMMPSWRRQVNWENCGIPWVNCAVFSVWKTTGNDSSEACAFACKNCAVYSVFPSGLTSHSKTAQFNWEFIERFRLLIALQYNYSPIVRNMWPASLSRKTSYIWVWHIFSWFLYFCMQFCDISIERKLFIRALFLEIENKLCASVPILHALWTAITYWKCYGKLQSTNKNTCIVRENTQGACFILNVS
jgi:hypothetical protein